ncbi:tripartite tricarboxylate transporter TctB family protein [uncultured Cohaesibacter sp.]|uniref:tripartite tricarboxylate transporter TctB family protein n=1 Tax=uncultured Cohaesibacter sp. TaxID=1002546 RepID=UPI0029C9A9C4|nr:tripartite tricarboxylate transporter TctB family protein [uncultured Cohaesibacter sp.]
MADGSSLFKVSIDFSQSHLFFPNIIHWILLILALLIALTEGPRYLRKRRALALEGNGNDKVAASKVASKVDWLRLIGMLVLTILYFFAMEPVGEIFPNTGLGFLLTSIPFMFLLSILFVHEPGRREFVTIALSSIISPVVAWYVLAQMFQITLP